MSIAWKTLLATSGAAASLALTAASPPAPVLVWNTTASAPVGLYRLEPTGRPVVGDLIVVQLPEPLASWFDEAGYLPRGVPLVKHVAAVAGQRICRSGEVLTVDGRLAARARVRDRFGRRLAATRKLVSAGARRPPTGSPSWFAEGWPAFISGSRTVGRMSPGRRP